MDAVRSVPFRWMVLATCTLLCYSLTQHSAVVSAMELGGGTGQQMATVAKHTATDHVREILGRALGRDDHSYSGSHSSSSSDERSDNGAPCSKMRSVVAFLFVMLAVSCQGTTSDREDIAGSKDAPLATFLQPVQVRLRDEQDLPDRRARELSYFGTGYSYNPYAGHHNALYTPYSSQHGLYNPYTNSPGYNLGALNGYGGAAGFGGAFGGVGNGAFLGTGTAGYPGAQFGGFGGIGQGAVGGAYPYGAGWNVAQSPYGAYGNQLGGYYNRGFLVVLAMIGLAVAYPAQQQEQQVNSQAPEQLVEEVAQLVPAEEGEAAADTEAARSKRTVGIGFGGVGFGVGLVGGGFGGYPGYGYGGGYPGFGYGGYYPGYGYRHGYRYGGYGGYGGGFGLPYYF
uniref:Uncharacterized protein n=1 Tax=Anopheles dirus TaxID=7168 RepID=A0A182NB01_9DIPT